MRKPPKQKSTITQVPLVYPSNLLTYRDPWESDANNFTKTSQKKLFDLYNVEKIGPDRLVNSKSTFGIRNLVKIERKVTEIGGVDQKLVKSKKQNFDFPDVGSVLHSNRFGDHPTIIIDLLNLFSSYSVLDFGSGQGVVDQRRAHKIEKNKITKMNK